MYHPKTKKILNTFTNSRAPLHDTAKLMTAYAYHNTGSVELQSLVDKLIDVVADLDEYFTK